MSRKSFKRRSLGKWTLRFIALFVASTLWFYVVNSEPIIIQKQVPLSFVTPEGESILNVTDWNIDLELQGARVFMQGLFESSEAIEVNLTTYSYELGESFEVYITGVDIPVPFGVEVLNVEPSILEVALEERVEKSINIEPNYIGSLPEDLRFVHQSLSPETLNVAGPVSMLEGLKQIRTQPIEVGELKGRGEILVQAHSPDRRIEILNEPELKFEYEVRPTKANLTLRNVPVHFMASARKFSAEQRHVALEVMAPDSGQRRLKKSEVRVIGEVPNEAKGRVNVSLRAELPEGVHLLKIHPSSIDVVVEDD